MTKVIYDLWKGPWLEKYTATPGSSCEELNDWARESMLEQRRSCDSVYLSELTSGQYRDLLDLTHLTVSHPTTDDLFPTWALRLHHALNFDFVTLGLYDSTAKSMRLDTWKAGDAQKICESVPVHSCASGWAWKNQRPVLVQDLDTEPRLPLFLGWLRRLGVRTYFVFPL